MIEEKYLRLLVSPLIQSPKDIKIERSTDERGVLLTMSVAEDDMGRVIGKQGNTAKALRTLLAQLGGVIKTHISLKINEPNM